MYKTSAHLRVGAIGLTLALVVSPVSAGDFWPHHHEKRSCFDKPDTTRIVIPSRQVEVVNERPQVIVREAPSREIVTRTVRHQTLAAPLAIGTIYMPMALPTVGAFPMLGAPQSCARETVEAPPHNPLESFHRAEVAQHQASLHAERAKAELSVTLASQQRVAARLGAPIVAPESGKCDSSVEKKLAELTSQMKEMNDRVTSIERLLIIHDNVIRDKVLPTPGVKATGNGVTTEQTNLQGPAKPMLPMIPPLPEK